MVSSHSYISLPAQSSANLQQTPVTPPQSPPTLPPLVSAFNTMRLAYLLFLVPCTLIFLQSEKIQVTPPPTQPPGKSALVLSFI